MRGLIKLRKINAVAEASKSSMLAMMTTWSEAMPNQVWYDFQPGRGTSLKSKTNVLHGPPLPFSSPGWGVGLVAFSP